MAWKELANIEWLKNGEPADGTDEIYATEPRGVLNRPLEDLWENTDHLKDLIELEHAADGQHTTPALLSHLGLAIANAHVSASAAIVESKLVLDFVGATRPGGGTYSSTLQLAQDILGMDLGDLHDVTVTSPEDGHTILYDSGTGTWVNQPGIVTDHGNLDGLTGDDHSQYLLASGVRNLTGDWHVNASDDPGQLLYRIKHLRDPEAGAGGAQDAVTRTYLEAQLASAAQGDRIQDDPTSPTSAVITSATEILFYNNSSSGLYGTIEALGGITILQCPYVNIVGDTDVYNNLMAVGTSALAYTKYANSSDTWNIGIDGSERFVINQGSSGLVASGAAFVIDQGDQVGLGTDSPDYRLHIFSDASYQNASAKMECISDTEWHSPQFLMQHYRVDGDTDSGDRVGTFTFQGAIGSQGIANAEAARITITAGTVNTSYVGGIIRLLTTDPSVGTGQYGLSVMETGYVAINQASAVEALDVNGGIKFGNALQETEGTIRWSSANNDYEGYLDGSWVSLTSGVFSMTTWTSVDTTPSVDPPDMSSLYFANFSAACAITDFDDGQDGQVIRILFGNSNATIAHNVTKINLQGGAMVYPESGDTISFVCKGGVWYELSRSVNS